MINKQKTSGFTLIELLVVVAIISLLTSIILTSLRDSRLKADDSKIIQQVREFQNAVALFYDDEDRYPNPGPNNVNGFICVAAQGTTCYHGSAVIPTVLPTNPDFAMLLNSDINKYANNSIINIAEAAPIINYLAYNLVNVPVVTVGNLSYGGGIIYECRSADKANCSEAYVYWPTNRPITKGTAWVNPDDNGPTVYKQAANDPGAGDGGEPEFGDDSYYH